MFNFLRRIFGSAGAKTVLAIAAAVAQERAEESLRKTDKFSESDKELIRQGIRQVITELLRADRAVK